MKKILISVFIGVTMLFLLGMNVSAYTLVNLPSSSGGYVTYRGSSTIVQIPNTYETKDSGFRGAWVSLFVSDMSAYTTETAWKNEVESVLKIFDYYNLNAMVFHVRTHNNALYDSALNPVASWWIKVDSQVFDPLTYLIDECHARGIEFHAWMNPYRISTATTDLVTASTVGQNLGESVPSNNPASDPSNLIAGSGGVILNPGLPKVREFIVDTCMEVIEKYDVDAIHFDDYFYISGTEDSATRAIYNTSGMSIADWRREQVNLFIEALHKEMSAYNIAHNRYVQLGISPSGIYRNGNGSVSSGSNTAGFAHYGDYLYSDTYKWANEGWIDYLLPQSYWGFEHPTAGYADVMDWWNKAMASNNCLLYSGIGYYMADSSGNTYSWQTNTKELQNQLTYLTKLEEVDGYCLYSFKYAKAAYQGGSAKSAIQLNTAKQYGCFDDYTILPEIKNTTPIKLNAVQNLIINGKTLTWDKVEGAKFYAIYRSTSPITYSNSEIVDVIGSKLSKISWYDSKTGTAYYDVRPISVTNTLGKASNPIPGEEASFELETDTSTNTALLGTEVTTNGGIVNGNTIQVGYTRCIFLNSEAPASSRLSYNFTSSNPTVATISKYGTITALGKGVTTIRAEYINDTTKWGEIEIVVYETKTDEYTVTFKDNDGKVLKAEKVKLGEDAIAPSVSNKTVGDTQYIFKGWDKNFTKVTSDLVITAVYEIVLPKYTVTFIDYDGTELKKETVTKGASATPPNNPYRSPETGYIYIFDGWDKDYTNITSDLIVKAKYRTSAIIINSFTVRFFDYDGTLISTQSVLQGEAAIPPTNPMRIKDEMYSYTFSKWDKEFKFIFVDTDVTAVYIKKLNTYNVTFMNDETIIKTESVSYGSSASAPSAPTKDETAKYQYTFKGWDKSFDNVKSDLIINALYDETLQKYLVKFVDEDDKILKEQYVEYGLSASAPSDPKKAGFKFNGWDNTFDQVTENLIIKATYIPEEIVVTYQVTFKDIDGTILKTETIEKGKAATAPSVPIKEGFVFIGWNQTYDNVKSDLVIMAMYIENKEEGCMKTSMAIINICLSFAIIGIIFKKEK